MSILKNGPWQELRPYRAAISIPAHLTMLTDEEVCYLHWLARDHYRGEGEIIDAGCLLGASTVAFASGLENNPHIVDTRQRIHSYDRFIYEEYMANISPANSIIQGEFLLPYFESNTRTYSENIQVYAGDLLQQNWNGEPIELLFIDVAKSWELSNHIVNQFFRSLIPGHSIVVQQDYFWPGMHWIQLTMQFLSPYFEPIHACEYNTLAFRLDKRIPSELLEIDYSKHFSPRKAVELMDQAIAQQTGIHWLYVNTAKIGLLIELQQYEPAHLLIELIKEIVSDANSSLNQCINLMEKKLHAK